MQETVNSATDATDRAMAFVKKYRMIARPLKAVRQDGNWLVEVDVGPIFVQVAKVKIDASSGDVVEYAFPG